MNINLLEEYNSYNYEGIIICLDKESIDTSSYSQKISKLIKAKKIEDKAGSSYRLTDGDSLTENILLLLDPKETNYRENLNYFSNSLKELIKSKSSKIVLDLRNFSSELLLKSAIEAAFISNYTFDKYKESSKEKKETSIDIAVDNRSKYDKLFIEAKTLSESTILARDLVNEPANIMTPQLLAEKSIDLGRESGFEVEVLEEDKILELGMESFHAVAKGSSNPPKFIIMRYFGDQKSKEILGLVGKGLTYDSGGLSIKPTSSMTDMKSDMAGAAAVIGAMSSIARMGLKKNVVAVVAACENMISGISFKPGDIINSMGGKTIFIGNTDAEGRLTLIDAMHYIVTKESITKVVDIATLTGAAIHCTGDIAAPVISNNDELFEKLNVSYQESGELIWRMPIFKEYKELLKHDEADLTNLAGSPGTITAALFIGEFTNDLPWAHIDIAGPSMSKKDTGYCSKGATGCGTRPLYYLAKSI